MDKFYSTLGWMVIGTLLVSTAIAIGMKGEREVLALGIAQVPLYTYMAIAFAMKLQTALQLK